MSSQRILLTGHPLPLLQDSQVLVELHKSGFARPGDVEFEDFSQPMNRAPSDSSLGTPSDGRPELRGTSRSRAKRWPFGKKNKVGTGALGVGWGGQQVGTAEALTESAPAPERRVLGRNFPLGCWPGLEGKEGGRPADWPGSPRGPRGLGGACGGCLLRLGHREAQPEEACTGLGLEGVSLGDPLSLSILWVGLWATNPYFLYSWAFWLLM